MSARLGLLFGGLLLGATALAMPVPSGEPAVMLGGTPARNMANTVEKKIPTDWSITEGQEKNVKWKARLGDAKFGTGPLVAEGKVFIGTNNLHPRDRTIQGVRGVLMCFDEKTGEFLWQIAHRNLDCRDFPSRCGTAQGFLASTPAVENGKLYYVSNRCELVCATTDKGKILWSLDMIGKLGVYPGGLSGGLANGSPLIVEDLVFVGTSNSADSESGKTKNPKAPSLIAVNKTTGKVVWQDASPGANIMDGQWSSPAAAKIDGRWQVIYGYGDGWLRGLDARTGKLLWKFDCNPKGLTFASGKKDSKNYIIATPVVHDGKVYIAIGQMPDNGGGIGHLWCIDITKKPANKELDLSPVANDFDPKSPKNKDSGLVWHHGGKFAIRVAGEGREFRLGWVGASVAVHDGIVYVAEQEGYLQALDTRTGQKLWEEDLKAAVAASPYYVDGKVFLGTEDGDLFVFEAGRTKNPLRVLDMDREVRTPPVAAHGVLFISNGESLYAIR